ncbi:MAG: tetratricopeptide repeat protein [Candidatus Edwardsbacteria bacterium]|nr:tetratricopeptide repeat protein [Candidatus Edwardsbacteria bacterium]
MDRARSITAEALRSLHANRSVVEQLLARYDEAYRDNEREKLFAQATGRRERVLGATIHRVLIDYATGRLDQGLSTAAGVMAELETGDHPEIAAQARNVMGNIQLRRCQFDRAQIEYRSALDIYERLGQQSSCGIVINNLGNIHNIRGEAKLALEKYQQALAIFERNNDLFRTAHVLNSISQIEESLGNIDRARDCLDRSLAIRSRLDDRRGIAQCLLNLANINDSMGDHRQALAHLGQVEALIGAHGIIDPSFRATFLGTRGIAHFHGGSEDLAARDFTELIALAENNGFLEHQAEGLSWLGLVKVKLGRDESGLEDIARALDLAEQHDLSYARLTAHEHRAEACVALGRTEEARESLTVCCRLAAELGMNEAAFREKLEALAT